MRRRPLLWWIAPLNIKRCLSLSYPVLSIVSNGYPRLKDRLPTCYSPVRHGIATIRLACIRHAASVNPEPGSNSLKISISHAESPPRIISSFQSYFSLASLLLRVPRVSPLPSRCSFKVFDEISFTLSLFPYRLCSLNLSMLFNFQGAICPP